MDFFVHLDERKWPLGEVRLYISGSGGGGRVVEYQNT